MKISEQNNSVIISEITDFNSTHTFECGQCFRWIKESDNSYTGIAHGKAVNILSDNDKIIINNTNKTEFDNLWKNYLDLERDYSLIKQKYTKDEFINRAIKFGGGIHILNQDIFECLISFIISTQNQIPRIMKIVKTMSEMFGTKIECGKDIKIFSNEYYAFPTVLQLEHITTKDLELLKAGYRADYIVDAVQKIASGDVDLSKIIKLDIDSARNELMKIKGVGPKVADCVLLFSAKKSQAFPIDVWVQRTMKNLYLGEKATNKQIAEFAAKNFGEFAGFAQQYLFYYSRENALK